MIRCLCVSVCVCVCVCVCVWMWKPAIITTVGRRYEGDEGESKAFMLISNSTGPELLTV